MLFNPSAIAEHLYLFLTVLFIVLVIKPVTAFIIVICFRYPFGIALSIAFALAQIGEFSFILAEEAGKFRIFPDEAYDVIVACALISISINPLLFKLLDYLPASLGKIGYSSFDQRLKERGFLRPNVLVVGYGLIGQGVVKTLERIGRRPLVIDRDVDIIANLKEDKKEAVYGDASFPNMLEMAEIKSASLLIITIPEVAASLKIIQYAREIKPSIKIIARAHLQADKEFLAEAGVDHICCEEEDVSETFNRIVRQSV